MTNLNSDAVTSIILASARSPKRSTRRQLNRVATKLITADAVGTAMDAGQVGLDAAGFVPGIGEVADAVNALVSLLRKDYLGAALSLISMVPAIGDAVGKSAKVAIWMSKLAKQQGKLGKAGQFLVKNGPKVKTALKTFSKVVSEHKESIEAGLSMLSHLVSNVGENVEPDPNAPPALNAAAQVLSKSKKLQTLAAKAKPHMAALQSATNGLLQLASASDAMFNQLDARARKEMGA